MADLGKMSFSSAAKITGCARRYYYYKVKKYPQDPDAPDDLHFRFGKAYHLVLEKCMHDHRQHTAAHIRESVMEFGLGRDEEIRIGSMVMSYFELHLKSALQCVACEFTIEDEFIIGHIDVVMKDRLGFWWIVDLKTAARVKESDLLAKLPIDLQLNLYTSFRHQVASTLGLDASKFRGCRYRVAQKPDLVVRDDDTVGTYQRRSWPLVVDVELPIEIMKPEAALAAARRANNYAQEIAETSEEEVPQNFGDCSKYFRPCEYWSRCYGQCYSAKPIIQAWTHGTMTDRTTVIETSDPFAELAEGFDFLN